MGTAIKTQTTRVTEEFTRISTYVIMLLYIAIVFLSLPFWANATTSQSNSSKLELLSQEEIAFLEAHPKLVVRNAEGLPPYTYTENGVFEGFWIDLLDMMFDGLNTQFVHRSRERSYGYSRYLNEDEALILTSMLITDERSHQMRFADPKVLIGYPAIIMRSNEPARRDIRSLSGLRIALPTGHFFERSLVREVQDIDIVPIKTFAEALEAVSYGLADATLQDIAIASYWAGKKHIPNLRPTGPAVFPSMKNQAAALAVAKENAILQRILNKLAADIAPVEMEKLREKWFLSSTDLKLPEVETIPLTVEEREYLNQLENIRICVDPNWMPYERIDREKGYEGIVADIIDHISHRLDIPIVLYETETWGHSLDALREGSCVLIPAAAPTESRRKWMDFAQPYLVLPLVIAVNSQEFFVEDLSAVMDKKLGVVRHYAHIDLIQKRVPDLTFVEVENVRDGLRKVQSGELFGFIDTVVSIGYSIRKNDMFDLKIGGKFDIFLKLSMAVRKGEDPQLLAILNKAVASIQDDEKRAILNKWFPVKFEQGIDYTLVWRIVVASTIILLIIVFWNRKLARLNKIIAKAHSEVERLSNTDQLTKLANRRYLDNVLEQELERVARYNRPLSLVMIDIDHFKSVNDIYGHDVGDKVLVTFSELLNNMVRKSDIAGRWGGEEFLLICPETDLSQAAKLAEILRSHIETTVFSKVGHKTASFGVASFAKGDTISDILQRADKALYLAKENGRNQVMTAMN